MLVKGDELNKTINYIVLYVVKAKLLSLDPITNLNLLRRSDLKNSL